MSGSGFDSVLIGLSHPIAIRVVDPIQPEGWMAGPMFRSEAQQLFGLRAGENEIHRGQFHGPDDGVEVVDELGSGHSGRWSGRNLDDWFFDDYDWFFG